MGTLLDVAKYVRSIATFTIALNVAASCRHINARQFIFNSAFLYRGLATALGPPPL
jgi:hypothetical protein